MGVVTVRLGENFRRAVHIPCVTREVCRHATIGAQVVLRPGLRVASDDERRAIRRRVQILIGAVSGDHRIGGHRTGRGLNAHAPREQEDRLAAVLGAATPRLVLESDDPATGRSFDATRTCEGKAHRGIVRRLRGRPVEVHGDRAAARHPDFDFLPAVLAQDVAQRRVRLDDDARRLAVLEEDTRGITAVAVPPALNRDVAVRARRVDRWSGSVGVHRHLHDEAGRIDHQSFAESEARATGPPGCILVFFVFQRQSIDASAVLEFGVNPVRRRDQDPLGSVAVQRRGG